VVEAEYRVTVQQELVNRLVALRGHQHVLSSARKLLSSFEQTLEIMRAHLALEEEFSRRSQDTARSS
jgi:hypothetical protein